MIGRKLSHFRILDRLGEGGMGIVYRAEDEKLRRVVALKVLPPDRLTDKERRVRFVREARTAAAVTHPNIAVVYEIDEADGVVFIAMEFIEGKTLRAAIGGKPMSLREALRLGVGIAEGLSAAHQARVIHRDLKPENILVTPEGGVKLLDFGLAKLLEERPEPAPGEASNQKTHSGELTQAGGILGTVPYMSPEQARGQTLDQRTDIWAFGCVLFEMLTGTALFHGPTASDAIVAILSREPDWGALPADVPEGVRRVLRRCLQKDVRRRLRDIADGLEDLATTEPVGDASGAHPGPRVRPVEFHRLTDRVGMNEWPAISPDGKMVAYAAATDGRRQIWIQLLAGGVPLQLTQADTDHSQPRWAPDSSVLVYHTSSESPGEEGTLWELPALGGVPRPITSALGGGDISHDGRRISLVKMHGGRVMMVTVARDGSDLRPVTPVSTGLLWRAPRWSFDDRWLAFHGRGTSVWDERLYIVPADGGESRPIARALYMRGAAWLPGGRGLVYSSSAGSTVPYPPTFNLRIVDVDGSHDTQISYGDVSLVEPDVHHTGRLVVCRIRSASDIWRFPVGDSPVQNTRDAVQVTRQTGQVQVPSVSPDGSRLVYLSDNGGHGNLWVAQSDGSHVRQITFERDPAVTIGIGKWSPTDQIVYVVRREVPELWIVRPDGRDARKLVDRGMSPCWSEDGRWLYYVPDRNVQAFSIEKRPVVGGPPVVVRGDDDSFAPSVGRGVLYFVSGVMPQLATWDYEIRRASPEDGPSEVIGRVAGARFPVSPLYVEMALSLDGRSLAMGLADGATTNVWTLGTTDGSWRQITDFGDQPALITRHVSWSPDGRHLYAAVCKIGADIVMLEGLV